MRLLFLACRVTLAVLLAIMLPIFCGLVITDYAAHGYHYGPDAYVIGCLSTAAGLLMAGGFWRQTAPR